MVENLKILKENLKLFTNNFIEETFVDFSDEVQNKNFSDEKLKPFKKMEEIREEKDDFTDSLVVLTPPNKATEKVFE